MGNNSPHTPSTLSIIGAGHVGKTLARRWQDHGVFNLAGVLNRSKDSSSKAAAFIGAGEACVDYNTLPSSDIYMIAVSDDKITACAGALAQAKPPAGTIAFHCSGALCSAELLALDKAGLKTASLHPLNSFTNPAEDIQRFAGTYCAIEGHPDAVDVLTAAVEKIGGSPVPIVADKKLIYHAGAVFACNYLSTVMDVSLQCYESAGIDREIAIKMITPLIETTLANIKEHGPGSALTGPIARGDAELVQKQYQAIEESMQKNAELYKHLALSTCDLAVKNDKITKTKSQEIKKVIKTPS